jgi:hypothetical protein
MKSRTVPHALRPSFRRLNAHNVDIIGILTVASYSSPLSTFIDGSGGLTARMGRHPPVPPVGMRGTDVEHTSFDVIATSYRYPPTTSAGAVEKREKSA